MTRRTTTDDLVSVRLASERVRVSPATMYRWIRSGELEACDGPRGRLVQMSQAEWVAQRARVRRQPATVIAQSTHVRALEAERDELRDRMQALEDERDTLRLRLGAIATESSLTSGAQVSAAAPVRWWRRVGAWMAGQFSEQFAVDGSNAEPG